ncbi:MAG: glycosyltransferase family 2 protein [Bdellovibrionaceae bacterium]|nr:glycosyltransferase family 2 protein [Pseudobdellovibrionaceae bacterium]
MENNMSNSTSWEVPSFNVLFWTPPQHRQCLVIPVINEGERIKSFIRKLNLLEIQKSVDILIIDGGSTDNSLAPAELLSNGIKGLLVKTGNGKLSAQLRCAYAFALNEGYEGIITIDGNDKDDPATIPNFVDALNLGYDFVQASRFLKGGVAVNTPLVRNFAIRMIHAPLLSLFSGFKWTDTTQGYRAYSRKMLLDDKIKPFRNMFTSYELLAYLSYRVPKLGYRCMEIATSRIYPMGEVPTKISSLSGNFTVFKILILSCLGFFNP